MPHNLLLPLFVYGSLRRGQQHHRLVRYGLLGVRAAVLPGAVMYDAGPYPYVLLGEGTVHGEVLEIRPEVYSAVLAALDRLEGYLGEGRPGNDYDRLCRTVVTGGGTPVRALVYVGGTARVDAVRAMPQVPGGDWIAHLVARRGHATRGE